MEFAYLFKALLRRSWIIVICVLVAGTIAYVLTRNLKREYKSTAQLATGFTVSEEMKLSDDRFNLSEIDVKFQNVIENIQSPKVRSLVSYRLMLNDLQGVQPFTKLSKEQMQSPAYKIVNKTEAIRILINKLDSIQMLSSRIPEEKNLLNFIDLYNYDVNALAQMLQVARYQRTDYINVVCMSENPYLSAYVVNAICNEFRRFYGLDKRTRSDYSIVALDSLVKQKKQILDEKINTKNQYMSNQGVVDVNMEGNSKLTQINTFESQLIDERANQQSLTYRIQELTTLIDQARANKGSSSGTANSGSSNNEYIRLKKQYDDLYSEYVRTGSSNADLKKRLDDLSEKMNKIEISNSTTPSNAQPKEGNVDDLVQKRIDAEAQLQSSTQKIDAIEARIAQLKGGLSGMAAKGANINQLDKEIEIASAEYTDAKDKLNMALNMGEQVQGNFKQTIIGEPALKPEGSKRMPIVAMACVVALLLSSLTIIAIEFFDSSIKTPTNFQRVTGLPLLGVVNAVDFRKNDIMDRVTHHDEEYSGNRENSFKENIRKMRYEIDASGRKIIMLTSTEPNQGKTTLTQALAYSLSLGKKKVLIIDTNFNNNDLTRAINATPVLEQFSLNGKPFSFEDAQGYITQSSVDGVDIIGCHGGDYTPSEILPKNHLLNYLDNLKQQYDFIFLEGAPLNDFTDSKELIKYAEGVIAVFSADISLKATDKESIKFLKQHKEKFLGAILNKVVKRNLNG
jgi:succinoglycan biosynthesis transport protein ExoP